MERERIVSSGWLMEVGMKISVTFCISGGVYHHNLSLAYYGRVRCP